MCGSDPPFPSSILAVLGIPPPQSLVSVPVVTALDGAAFSSPALPTQVTWGGTAPWPSSSLPTTGNPWAHVATSTPVQPGLTLSPAAQPFPKKLVDKARAGHLVEMKELLADNVSLLSQLEAVQGSAAISMLGPTRPRLREVTTLPTWCYCFLGYMAMCTTDPQTRNQMAYARLLIKEAQRGGHGWLDYDRAFRQQAVGNPSVQWNTVNPGLQASTILGQPPAGQGPFCTLCREVDHTRAQCALSCLEPPATTTGPPKNVSRGSSVQRRPPANVCISWNKGACVFPGECFYRHVCATCQSTAHKARDCSRTSDTSVYKLLRNTSRPRPSIAGPAATTA